MGSVHFESEASSSKKDNFMSLGIAGVVVSAFAAIVGLLKDQTKEKFKSDIWVNIFLLTLIIVGAIIAGMKIWSDYVELGRSRLISFITSKNEKERDSQDQNSVTVGKDGQIIAIRIRGSINETIESKKTKDEDLWHILNKLVELGDASEVERLVLNTGNIAEIKGIEHLENLKYLEMKVMPDINDEDLIHLSELELLETLNLDETKVKGDGLKHITKCSKLKKLILSHINFKKEDLNKEAPQFDIEEAIKYIGMIPSIEELNFYGTGFKLENEEAIIPLLELKKLRSLTLGGNEKGPKAIINIKDSETLKKLNDRIKNNKKKFEKKEAS